MFDNTSDVALYAINSRCQNKLHLISNYKCCVIKSFKLNIITINQINVDQFFFYFILFCPVFEYNRNLIYIFGLFFARTKILFSGLIF